jgi:hypothetical protein
VAEKQLLDRICSFIKKRPSQIRSKKGNLVINNQKKMVKDLWDQSPVAVLNSTTTQTPNQKHDMVTLDHPFESQKTTQAKEPINNNNVWGCFNSRENFIDMHIC